MSDKLRQIWSGFEAKTTRRLTGRGIENIVAPHRSDEDRLSEQFLPKDFTPPSEAAFSALRLQLSTMEKEVERSKARRGGGRRARQTFDASRQSGAHDAGEAAIDLLMGLEATERRVERSTMSYGQFLASNAGGKLSESKKRKKFLGLF